MKKRIKNTILSVLVVILTSWTNDFLYAQEISFKASAPPVVTLGVGFNYTLTGNENIRASDIQVPEAEGLRFIAGPSTFVSNQSSIINGRRENITQVTFTYTFIATQEGKITIPPAIIKQGNKSYSTDLVEITVMPASAGQTPQPGSPAPPVTEPQSPGTNQNYFIRLIPSKRSVWLGEELLISAKIYTNENLRFSEIKYPEFEGFWKQEMEADQQASRETIDGNQYLTQVFKRDLLIPQKTGTLAINPVDATVLLQQRVRTQRRNPFGDIFNDPFFSDPFFDSYQNVPANIKSNPLNIEVKNLPSGAPAGFNGAVGQFTADLSAGRQNINVNEALSLKLVVQGNGNLSLLKSPNIDFPPDIEVFEPKIAKNISHTVNGTTGSVIFEYVIIPRYPGTFRIAPVIFSYFDPAKSSYQSLRTKDITITVEKSASTDQAEIMGMQPGISGLRQEQVTSLNTDILFIKTNIPVWRPLGITIADSIFFRLSFPAGIIVFILLLILQRERIRRNSDLAYARTRKARKIAVKRLKTAKKLLQNKDNGMYDEILKAFWGYIGDKLSVDQANLSRISAENGLRNRNVPEEIIHHFLELIDECEMARYATGIVVNPDSVYHRSEDLLYKLESSIT